MVSRELARVATFLSSHRSLSWACAGVRRTALGRRLALAFALVALLLAGRARADDEAEGKRRFLAGQKLYAEGKYLEAAREFEAGYAAAPRGAFLLNIGHSYRLAGELEKARANYELLLELEPSFGKRAEVEQHLADIARQLAPPPAEPPLATPPPGEPSPGEPSPAAPPPSAQPEFEYERPSVLVLRDEDIPEKKKDDASVFGSPWFWVGVAVVAGGVVAGALLLGGDKGGCAGTICLIE